MNEVKISIPADMLRGTVSALSELAIRQRMEALKLSGCDQIAAESLKQAAATQKLSDYFFELYLQRPVEQEAAPHEEV